MMSPVVIDLTGAPYDRGRVHGERARTLIHDGIVAWREALGSKHEDVDAYLARFLGETDFVRSIERHTPQVLEEVHGIADGAGVDRQTIYAFQLMDEEWCFEQRERQGAGRAHHCTSVGVMAEGARPLVAMNLDLPAHVAGTQVVLRIHGDGDEPSVLALAVAGRAADTGCNETGVAVVVNALGDVPSAAVGLPVVFVIRGILAQGSLAAARDFVERVPHASGQNYLMGDPEGICDLECSSEGAIEYAPDSPIVHTNHALAPAPGARSAVESTASSRDRLGFVEAALGSGAADPITWNDVGAALGDRTVPVCRVPTAADPWITFGTVIMELDTPPGFRLAIGHPSEAGFEEVGFARERSP